ncbi:beta-glucosidase [Egibacter rhizosphaerae]|uniref:Beta-glucosidase n=1 Tax=Egibacter rhizosphaerae TaxID=1670831 RepID=A0A411YA79_9ACTN|nr:GH1 family beta-glucosidase [Egibacter rhizosphaerae]QBI18114.1 beta-glucosidase [Egibacter rhizosphaerae]
MTLEFPPGFVWGVATSAYQIEGAVDEDGRGPSIWDTLSHTPGAVRRGENGDIAVDHYHRVEEDLDLIATLGVGAYRFSLAWPRIQPDGRGAVNERGLDFYRRLVDGLLERGITPVATLYHWDLPQALENAGGWPARDTAHRFAEYASKVGDALGDRIGYWITINEPWCAAFLGYSLGQHAPGRAEPSAAVAAAHHLLLGHGEAVDALRATAPEATLMLALNFEPTGPATNSDADRDAARRADGLYNRLFMDAVLGGAYPEDVLEDLTVVSDLAHIRDGDLDVISRPVDALGVNYYTTTLVRAGDAPAEAAPTQWPGSAHVVAHEPEQATTAMGWRIDPDGLERLLRRISSAYPRTPLYVTENGAAFDDEVGPDGIVDDVDRIAYLEGHLRAVRRALDHRVDVHGYFVWTLMDNFEWASGYDMRFGLIRVNGPSRERVPKRSFGWYRDMLRANALVG